MTTVSIITSTTASTPLSNDAASTKRWTFVVISITATALVTVVLLQSIHQELDTCGEDPRGKHRRHGSIVVVDAAFSVTVYFSPIAAATLL
jgi:hypothetical protein